MPGFSNSLSDKEMWQIILLLANADAKETAAAYQASSALREVESGNRQQALSDARAALKLAPNRDVRSLAAVALARAGDIPTAKKLAAGLDKDFPLDTMVQRYWLPTIRAALALGGKGRDGSRRAVEILQAASAIELGQPTNLTVFLCPAYLRGEAYLTLHDGNAASAEFQKFIERRGLVANFQWGALARLGLARAYAMQGDPKAKAAYQDFLALWKDADPDIPIFKQARAEYGKLTLAGTSDAVRSTSIARAVLRDRQRGMSLTEVAKAHRISRAFVSRIVREHTRHQGLPAIPSHPYENKLPVR